MKLYYLRHGQSQANVEMIYPPSEDTPLTELGQSQAEAAVGDVEKAGITAIYCSDYPRAQDSVNYP